MLDNHVHEPQALEHCAGPGHLGAQAQGRPKLAIGVLADVKTHNIPGQRDVELNELAKQILMLLPLLLLLLLLMYILYLVLLRECKAPS